MIWVLRHVRDRHNVRNHMLRSAGGIAILGMVLACILLSACACPATEAYCPPAYQTARQ